MVNLSLEYIGQFSNPIIRMRLLRRFDEADKLSELERILEEENKELKRIFRKIKK